MGWQRAFEEECELSQDSDRQCADVFDSRSDSGTETAGTCGGSNHSCTDSTAAPPKGLALWWVRKLVLALRSLGMVSVQQLPKQGRLTVVSGCSGCSAESAVLQAGSPCF